MKLTPSMLEAIFAVEPLYALMDAAANRDLCIRLREFSATSVSLYRSAEQDSSADDYVSEVDELQQYGPWLIILERNSQLTRYLLEQGWGQAWGVYLSSRQPLETVHNHLRRFLIVQDEKKRRMYFRFSDPRVLRQFLAGCTPEELREFYGPVDAFWVESRSGQTLVHFTMADGRLARRELMVSS